MTTTKFTENDADAGRQSATALELARAVIETRAGSLELRHVEMLARALLEAEQCTAEAIATWLEAENGAKAVPGSGMGTLVRAAADIRAGRWKEGEK
jgi:hypothetical protein